LWSCVLISRLCLSSSRVYGRAHHRGVRSSPTRRSSDLGSMWDPYGNVGKLPVAVVNHDRPAVLDGRALHIGKDLAEELKGNDSRSEEHTSELQSRFDLVCRLLLEKKTESKRASEGHGRQ